MQIILQKDEPEKFKKEKSNNQLCQRNKAEIEKINKATLLN